MTDSQVLLSIQSTVFNLVGIGETTNLLLNDIIDRLKEPPSTELPDLLRGILDQMGRLTGAVTEAGERMEALSTTVAAQGARISALRDQIAKAMEP